MRSTTTSEFEIIDAITAIEVIKSAGKRFYVYVLLRPNGAPFYVGKGLGKRLFQHEAEARNTTLKSHKLNVIRATAAIGAKIGYAIPHFCDDEAEAHTFEVELIRSIGRHDLRRGPLTNQTDGGEGITGLSAATMERKAANLGGASDDPQRRLANEFFHSITGQQASVPIKPLGARRLEPTIPHPSPRKPTERMARVLVAVALSTNQLLSEGIILPRLFEIKENKYVIENGAAKDMFKSGMIHVEHSILPELEQFVLTRSGLDAILTLIPRAKLQDLGVMEPTP